MAKLKLHNKHSDQQEQGSGAVTLCLRIVSNLPNSSIQIPLAKAYSVPSLTAKHSRWLCAWVKAEKQYITEVGVTHGLYTKDC